MRALTLPVVAALLAATAAPLPAQDWTWEWISSATGGASARGAAVAASGEILVVGHYLDTLELDTISLTSNGGADVFLLKLTAGGRAIWGRSFGGEWEDYGRGVAVDPQGGVYITGEFCSNTVTFDTVTLVNNHQTPHPDQATFDVFTVKLASDGNVVWAASGGGFYQDHVSGIELDGSARPHILGHFLSGSITFDSLLLTNSGNRDLYLAKYDAYGHALWLRGAVGTGQDDAWSLTVDAEDNVYIAGSYRSSSLTFDDLTLVNTSTDFDLYLVRMDPNGNAVWVRSATGAGWDEGSAIVSDGHDSIYLTGHFSSDSLSFAGTTLCLSPSGSTNLDMYVTRFDRDGSLVWARSSTGGSWVYPHAIAAHGAATITIAGTFNGLSAGYGESFGVSGITPIDSYDIFLVQYDSLGTDLWAESLGGRRMDWGQDVAGDELGGVYLAAYFDSDSITIGDSTLINDFNNKMFVAKKSEGASSVRRRDGERDRGIRISNWPNPFERQTTIAYSTGAHGEVELSIYNVGGRLVRTLVKGRMSAGVHVIAWDGTAREGRLAPAGVYFCRLKSGEQSATSRMIVLR